MRRMMKTVLFSCRFTNADLLYQRLDERLEWKHGRTYVPKGNKRLMCFLDDINLSQVSINLFCLYSIKPKYIPWVVLPGWCPQQPNSHWVGSPAHWWRRLLRSQPAHVEVHQERHLRLNRQPQPHAQRTAHEPKVPQALCRVQLSIPKVRTDKRMMRIERR